MNRCAVIFAFVLAVATTSRAQEFPKPTPAGMKAAEELVARCVAAGGLKLVQDDKTGASTLSPGDGAKLKTVVGEAGDSLTPSIFDALIARWRVAEGDHESALIALLRVAGEVADNDRAVAFATFFEALRNREGDGGIALLSEAARRFQLSDERAWQAECHDKIGFILCKRADFALALESYFKALEVRRATLSERHPDIATSYDNIANVYADQGENARALEMSLKALDVRRAALGDRHPDVADSYNNIAIVYAAQEELTKALEFFSKALEIRRVALGERHPDVATCYNNIANIYNDQGEHARALEMYHKALDIRLAVLGAQHPRVASTYTNIATVYHAQGELAMGLGMHLKALEVFRVSLGERHPHVATSYSHIGAIYHDQGEHAKALEMFFKALDVRRAALGERHPDVADCYNGIALVYADQDENALALEMHLKALDVRRAALGERHPGVARSYNNIANVYLARGENAQALEMYLKALEIFRAVLGEFHLEVAGRYNNIASVYSAQGEHALALEMYHKAMEIYRVALGERHPDVAEVCYNIGNVYRAQGKNALALEMHLKSLDVRRAALGERHPNVADSYYSIANLYRIQGDQARALEEYGCALVALGMSPEADQPGDLPQDAPSLTPLPLVPRVLLARGRLRELRPGSDSAAGLRATLGDYRAAADALDLLREGSSRDEDKVRKAEDVSDLFPRAVGAAARLAAASGTTVPLLESLAFAERGAARVFLEGLGRSRASAFGRVAPAALAEKSSLAAEIRQLNGRIVREQDKPFEKRNREAVERLFLDRKRTDEAWRALVARMDREFPEYAALKHPRPCSVAEARACLADDEVALFYVLASNTSYLLILSARDDATGGLAIHKLPPSGEIAEAVAALTQAKVLEDADATRERGEAAYQMLLAPASQAIAGKRLVIVPGGVLGQLPFELLAEPVGGGGTRFLIQGHSIRYAPSLTVLHMIRRWEGERPEVGRTLWALGDPVYAPTDSRITNAGEPSAEAIRLAARLRGGERGTTFERLTGTGREVERLAGLMGSGADERLLGPDATEATVKRLSDDGTLAKYRYVHFACHGVLGTGDKVQPGLVLSQLGNTEGQDGYLRMDEVTDLRLNADLVTLSACQTGQGKVFRAEGVSGLARAFLYAGSRGVLCSLWQVDDAATADLMAETYANLKAGQSSADALRSAQLKMIEAGEPPLHWAPFVLIGR